MNMTYLTRRLSAIPHPSKISVESVDRSVRIIYRRATAKEIVALGALIPVIGLTLIAILLVGQNTGGVFCFGGFFVFFGFFAVGFLLLTGVHEACAYTFDPDTGQLTGTGKGMYAGATTRLPLTALRDFRIEKVWWNMRMVRVVATDVSGKKHTVIEKFPIFWDGEECAAFFVAALQICARTASNREHVDG